MALKYPTTTDESRVLSLDELNVLFPVGSTVKYSDSEHVVLPRGAYRLGMSTYIRCKDIFTDYQNGYPPHGLSLIKPPAAITLSAQVAALEAELEQTKNELSKAQDSLRCIRELAA